MYVVGRDSADGTATRYGLHGRWSNPDEGEILHTRPDRLWGPHPASYKTGIFPGVKRPKRGVNQPPPSCAEIEESVELYLCSPCGISLPVLGWNLTLLLVCFCVCVHTRQYIYTHNIYPLSILGHGPQHIEHNKQSCWVPTLCAYWFNDR